MKIVLAITTFLISLFCVAQIATDGTMGNIESLIGPEFQIDQSLGETVGSNLFHSFSEFNLNSGESATFNGDSSITNIFSRVTGGVSTIDGSVNCSIDGANLFLLNQSGILFGPDATINLSGSFHVSTANFLQFSDSSRFFSTPVTGELLSSAAPESFGFLGDSGEISIDGSKLTTAEEKTLSLSSDKLTIKNGSELSSDSGTIKLESLSLGTVNLSENSFSENTTGSDLTICENSQVDVSGKGGGKILIKGGEVIVNSSNVEIGTNGDVNGGLISILSGELLISNNSYIRTKATGDGNTADIILLSSTLEITDLSTIESNTNGKSGGAGDILITSDNTTIDNSYINNKSLMGSGKTGDISINSDNLTMQNGSIISNSKLGMGVGKNGSINLNIENELSISASQITSETVIGMVEGGDININARKIKFENYTTISSLSRGMGNAGTLSINAGEAKILSGSLVETSALSGGNGGTINLSIAGSLTIDGSMSFEDGEVYTSQILSRSVNSGDGGNVQIEAKSLTLSNGGGISTASESTNNPGDAGNISINCNTVELSKNGRITAESMGSTGGQIEIDSANYLALYDSDISTNVHNGSGDAGDIIVNTGNLVLNSSFFRADAHGGYGGNIFVDSLTIMKNYGSFFDASSKLGLSGELIVKAPQTYINEEIEELITEFLPADDWVKNSRRSQLGKNSSFRISKKSHKTINFDKPLVVPPSDQNEQNEPSDELKQFLGF